MAGESVYERAVNQTVRTRIANEPRRHIQFVQGPRQVGKTTSIQQVLPSTSHHMQPRLHMVSPCANRGCIRCPANGCRSGAFDHS
jgi:hypothetical protein